MKSKLDILQASKHFRKKKKIDFQAANFMLKKLFSFRNKEHDLKVQSYFEHEIKSIILMGIDELHRGIVSDSICSETAQETSFDHPHVGPRRSANYDASGVRFDDCQLQFLLLILSDSKCPCYDDENVGWNHNCTHWEHRSKEIFLILTKKLKWNYVKVIAKELVKNRDHRPTFWKGIYLFIKFNLYDKNDIVLEKEKDLFLSYAHQKSISLIPCCKVFLQFIKLDLETSIPILISSFTQGVTAEDGDMKTVLCLFAESLSSIFQLQKHQRSFAGSIFTFVNHLFHILDQLLICDNQNMQSYCISLQILLQVVSILYSSFAPRPADKIRIICMKLFQIINEYSKMQDCALSPDFLKACVSFMHRALTSETAICSGEFLQALLYMNYCTSLERFQSSPLNQSNSLLIMKCFYLVTSHLEQDVVIESLDNIPTKIYAEAVISMMKHINDFIELFGDGLLYSLSTINVLLQDKKGRTAFGDSNFFTIIFSNESLTGKILKSISSKEQSTALLLLECLHAASRDSSVRFKLKLIVIPFFAILFKACCQKSLLSTYEDRVLNHSTLFLNEFFGHDIGALSILAANEFPLLIIDFLYFQVGEQLDVSSAALSNMSSLQCLLSLAHLLDSILRADNAKKWLISHQEGLEKLVQVALRTSIADISSVCNKILARILSDTSLTILLCNENTFYVVFKMLMDPINSSVSTELLKAIETRFQLCEDDIFSILVGVYEYSPIDIKFNAMISLPLVSPIELLKGISGKTTKLSRSFCRLILGTLIEHYTGDAKCSMVIKYLSTKTAGIFGESMRYVIDHETAILQHVLESDLTSVLSKLDYRKEMLSLVSPEDESRIILFPKSWLLDESPPFKAMLEGSFAESRQGAVSLHDASDRCWEIVLIFICFKHIDVKDINLVELSIPSNSIVSLVADALLISQEFLIDSLKEAILKWIYTICTLGSISRNPELISHVYSSFVKSCQTIDSVQEAKHHIIQSFFISLKS